MQMVELPYVELLLQVQQPTENSTIDSYQDALPYLAAPVFLALTLAILVWRMAHQRRIHTFLLVQLSKLHDSLVQLDRAKSAEVSATLTREIEESRHPFPYLFAIRPYADAPGLPEVLNRAVLNIDAVNERLHPKETTREYEWRLRIDTEHRGRMLEQDLRAEIPRFERQLKEISKNHSQQRWLASQAEITRLRQAILGVNVEIRNNPAIAAQLMEVLSVLTSFEETMTRSRDEGAIPNSQWGEMADAWLTGVLHQSIEKRFGVKAP